VFAPTYTVSGLSVLYLRVMQGTLRMQASSWTPPESVQTIFAFFRSLRNSKYPSGSIILIDGGIVMPY